MIAFVTVVSVFAEIAVFCQIIVCTVCAIDAEMIML